MNNEDEPLLSHGNDHGQVSNRQERDNSASYNRETSASVTDKFYIAYIIFFLIGIGTLLPWNFFINAKEYFSYKLRNVSADTNATNYDKDQTHLQIMFEGYIAIASMVPNVFFMFLNALMTRWLGVHLRIMCSFFVLMFIFAVTILFSLVKTDCWQVGFFVLTLFCVVIMNASSAVLQGAILGVASKFPKAYCQAIMSGMGMGGTIAALANLLVIWLHTSPWNTGLSYFAVAEVFIVLGFVGYLFLPTMEFSAFYMNARFPLVHTSLNEIDVHDSECVSSESVHGLVSFQDAASFCQVFRKLWQPSLTVFLVFFVSLACFPAIISAIKPYDHVPNLSDTYFTAVTCFLFFNLFDFGGRMLAGVTSLGISGPIGLIIAVLRIGFIPLFLFCNVQPRHHLPIYIHYDLIVNLLVILLGLTNGFLSTLSMMRAPRYVSSEDYELAGAMMSLFLSVGLASGALTSFALLYAV